MDEAKIADVVALKAKIDAQRKLIDWLGLKNVELSCHRDSVFYAVKHPTESVVLAAIRVQAGTDLTTLLNQLKAM